MTRPIANLVLLTVLVPACSLMPPEREHVRSRQIENAVLPMATTALESGQLETARRLNRRLLDMDPDSFQARMGLGDVALRERETTTAARWYLAALNRAGEPAQRHAALVAHGRAALAAGDLEEARESFSRLTEVEENASRASVAWGHNGVGLTLLLEGDLDGAVTAMEHAVLSAPEEERFQANLDRALAMLSGYPDSVERSRELLGLGPSSESAPVHAAPTQSPDTQREILAVEPEEIDTPGADDRHADGMVGEFDASSRAKPPQATSDPHSTGSELSEDTGHAVSRQSDTLVDAEKGAVEGPDGAPSAPNATQDDQPRTGSEDSNEKAIEDTIESTHRLESEAADSVVQTDAEPELALDRVDKPSVADPRLPKKAALSPSRSSVLYFTENGLPYVQVGAYAKRSNADAVTVDLRTLVDWLITVSQTPGGTGDPMHRVRVGPLPTEQALVELLDDLESHGYSTANRGSVTADGNGERATLLVGIETLLVSDDGGNYIQAGAYGERSKAESLAEMLRSLTDRGVHVSEAVRSDAPTLHRVRIGPLEESDPVLELFGLTD